MRTSYASQYQTGCVVIESRDVTGDHPITADDVLEQAMQSEAIYCDVDGEQYVIDFRVGSRRVGPEVYTERALRFSLTPRALQRLAAEA